MRRGRRRQRTGGDTLWRLPRWAARGADTTDSEGNRSASTQRRGGDTAAGLQTPGGRSDPGRESPHPLLDAIDNMEAQKEVPEA
ncbi:hypothetical protein NDU88_004316 [Pleurodeles waltl]|uniref:Uncharacterized protein n=1 Tax=Pleurodeles waltl TaxID=8319 RepID=A0AAV7T815_PLEWA|nr:hypothetical protein NDU88_004316 [Pleurodeles waltl]